MTRYRVREDTYTDKTDPKKVDRQFTLEKYNEEGGRWLALNVFATFALANEYCFKLREGEQPNE